MTECQILRFENKKLIILFSLIILRNGPIDLVTFTVTRVEAVEKSTSNVVSLEQRYKDAIRKTEVSMSLSELHSKRLNITAYNVPQEDKWESREKSLETTKFFLKHILKIDKGENMVIVDAHRMHVTQPRLNQPLSLIFKLSTMEEKRLLAANLKQLSTFNEHEDKKKKIFVDLDNLLVKMQKDKQALMSMYIEARKSSKQTKIAC